VEPDFGAFFGPFRVPNFPVLLGFCVPRVVFEPVLDRLRSSDCPPNCPAIAPACRNVTAIWMGFCIDKFLVQVGQRWVPKSRTKLTRTLWYTVGTARDFESKRPQSARSFSSQFSLHIKPSLQ
jgi:hypothetical protein